MCSCRFLIDRVINLAGRDDAAAIAIKMYLPTLQEKIAQAVHDGGRIDWHEVQAEHHADPSNSDDGLSEDDDDSDYEDYDDDDDDDEDADEEDDNDDDEFSIDDEGSCGDPDCECKAGLPDSSDTVHWELLNRAKHSYAQELRALSERNQARQASDAGVKEASDMMTSLQTGCTDVRRSTQHATSSNLTRQLEGNEASSASQKDQDFRQRDHQPTSHSTSAAEAASRTVKDSLVTAGSSTEASKPGRADADISSRQAWKASREAEQQASLELEGRKAKYDQHKAEQIRRIESIPEEGWQRTSKEDRNLCLQMIWKFLDVDQGRNLATLVVRHIPLHPGLDSTRLSNSRVAPHCATPRCTKPVEH